MPRLAFATVCEQNTAAVQAQVGELDEDNLSTVRIVQAIATKDIIEHPDCLEDEESQKQAYQNIIEDVQHYFDTHGMEDKLKRWLAKKAVEAAIYILISFYQNEWHTHYKAVGSSTGDFRSDLKGFACSAEQVLQ